MQEVEAICDRVIIIHKGNIVADDQIKALQRRSPGIHSVKVEFKESVDLDRLTTLPAVLSATSTGPSAFTIACNDAEQVKKQLLEFSINQQLNIVSLQSEVQNLESVFKSLTT